MRVLCRVGLILIVLIKILALRGIQCFFIKNVESGQCVLANEKPVRPPFPNYGSLHVLKLQDDCFAKRAQFHFLSTNALRNDEAAGCLRGYIKHYLGYYQIIFLYKHIDSNKDYVCGPKSIITQSKEGALMLEYPKDDPKINCAMPSVKYQSGDNAGTLMEFLATCDNKKQNFKFGSITCEGVKTSKANCAGTQVMIIINAFYGLSSKIKQCGYTGSITKTLDVTCKMSSLCDGKSSCEVTVGNWLSDNRDPYPGKPKYLYFEYQCLNKTAPATPKPGSNVCSNQLLVSNKKIPDSSFTSSSHTSGHEAYKARFSSQSSWCASDCTTTPYLQIDLGKDLYIIRHVTTRGDAASGKWVGSYNLEYTSDGNNWKKATSSGSYIFPGNDVRNDQVDMMIAVDKDVFAQKLKFLPVLYYKQACMSVEICADLFVNPGPPTNLKTVISPRMVALSWKAPQNKGDGGVSKYVIQISHNSVVQQTYEVDSQYTAKYLNDLIPNTKYQISIASKNDYVSSIKAYKSFTTLLESTLICEGRSTKNVGCPSSQVMIIKQAYYGVSNTIDSCGYRGSSDCQIDVLCQLKELCDGQQYCNVSANSTFFKHGECSMAKKHLYFEYQCLDKTVSKENKPARKTLKITKVPDSPVYVEIGKSLKLDISYEYDGTKGIQTDWKKGGSNTAFIRRNANGNIFGNVDNRALITDKTDLVLNNITLSDNTTFEVLLSAADTLSQPDETIQVIVVQAQKTLKITKVPDSPVYVEIGKVLKLDISYEYDGTAGIQTDWKKGGSNTAFIRRTANGHILGNVDNRALTDITDLVLNSITLCHNTTFEVLLTAADTLSQPDEIIQVIVVQELPVAQVQCTKPININRGDTVECDCKAIKGIPTPWVTWYDKDNKPIGSAGYGSKKLSINNIQPDKAGIYKCKAEIGSWFVGEDSLSINVQYSPENVKFGGKIAYLNTWSILACSAEGFPTPTYTISHKGTEPVKDSTSGTYTIKNVKKSDAGKYTCEAKNALGNITTSINVKVVGD